MKFVFDISASTHITDVGSWDEDIVDIGFMECDDYKSLITSDKVPNIIVMNCSQLRHIIMHCATVVYFGGQYSLYLYPDMYDVYGRRLNYGGLRLVLIKHDGPDDFSEFWNMDRKLEQENKEYLDKKFGGGV
jgi:hypothetical protein